MSTYGSSAYGSDSLGGGGGAGGQVFFTAEEPLVTGLQSRTAAYVGQQSLYAVKMHIPSTSAISQIKVYTSTSEGETPQLQVTLGPSLDAESVVGAAAFITVEVEAPSNLSSGGMVITGREVV